LIQATVAGSPAHDRFRVWATGGETFGISSVAWAEFLCGPVDTAGELLAKRLFLAPEPFLATDATLAAALFNRTGRRSRSLADCMIAAVAIRLGARLATENRSDFDVLQPYGLSLA
jgi:predicted nucleic acid-binding protein